MEEKQEEICSLVESVILLPIFIKVTHIMCLIT